ncbi:MAG: DUF5675 family protein [Bacteroidota bacterium]
MWSFLRNFFQQIFGAPKEEKNPSPAPSPSSPTPNPEPAPTPAVTTPIPEGAKVISLQRTAHSSQGIVGNLSIEGTSVAQTLENAVNPQTTTNEQPLPAGYYPLALRKEGGIHSTYIINLGEAHHGMIQIVSPDQPGFRYLQMGNEAQYAYGSILLGKEVQTQEEKLLLTFTESVYRDTYNQLYPLLANEQPVYLHVKDPN